MLSIDLLGAGSAEELLMRTGPLASVGALARVYVEAEGLLEPSPPVGPIVAGNDHLQLIGDGILIEAVAEADVALLLADLEALEARRVILARAPRPLP